MKKIIIIILLLEAIFWYVPVGYSDLIVEECNIPTDEKMDSSSNVNYVIVLCAENDEECQIASDVGSVTIVNDEVKKTGNPVEINLSAGQRFEVKVTGELPYEKFPQEIILLNVSANLKGQDEQPINNIFKAMVADRKYWESSDKKQKAEKEYSDTLCVGNIFGNDTQDLYPDIQNATAHMNNGRFDIAIGLFDLSINKTKTERKRILKDKEQLLLNRKNETGPSFVEYYYEGLMAQSDREKAEYFNKSLNTTDPECLSPKWRIDGWVAIILAVISFVLGGFLIHVIENHGNNRPPGNENESGPFIPNQ